MSFRKNLEYLRKGKKLSQEDLADKLGISRQSVSKWESGAAYPETDKMLALCKLFDCTLDELMNQDMQEEKLEESRKYTFNDFLKSVTGIVDRSIKMITSMNAKSLFKFVLEIGVLLLLIILMRLPFQYIYDAGANIFTQIDSRYFDILRAFWKFLIDIVYLVVSVVGFVYIYKVRFLDPFESIEVRETFKKEKVKEKGDQPSVVKSEVKEVKKVEKRNVDFGIFRFLGKVVLFFVKCFVAFCTLFIVFFFLCSVAGVVVSISWMFEGVVFVGVLLFLLTLIAFLGMLIVVLYNFIFNRKSAWRKILIVLLGTLVGFGISAGVGLLELKEFTFVDVYSSNVVLDREVKEFEMRDDLLIESRGGVNNFVIENGLGNRIRVEVAYSKKLSNIVIEESTVDDNRINVYAENKKASFKELYGIFLHDLRRKEIRSDYKYVFDGYTTVYGSEENLEKIRGNRINWRNVIPVD
ncbi:MAG: helix-turn-helix domain-containing protein [Candidatus Dojkabacteria bacterium]|jgi:transcriptional regulator with XRE-family HTH domain